MDSQNLLMFSCQKSNEQTKVDPVSRTHRAGHEESRLEPRPLRLCSAGPELSHGRNPASWLFRAQGKPVHRAHFTVTLVSICPSIPTPPPVLQKLLTREKLQNKAKEANNMVTHRPSSLLTGRVQLGLYYKPGRLFEGPG